MAQVTEVAGLLVGVSVEDQLGVLVKVLLALQTSKNVSFLFYHAPFHLVNISVSFQTMFTIYVSTIGACEC